MAPGVRPILGFWQELAPLLADASFDSVLFDAFPNDAEQLSEEVIHQRGFMAHAHLIQRADEAKACVDTRNDADSRAS